jgi:surface antigen
MKKTPLLILSFFLFLSSCTHQQQGAAVGGVAGGVTGFLLTKDSDQNTQIAAILAGAVTGGVIGGVIGTYMDQSDQKRIQKALKEVPTNKSRSWTNPNTGHRFTIKPISDIATDSDGQKYRDATLYARKKNSTKLDATTKKMYL